MHLANQMAARWPSSINRLTRGQGTKPDDRRPTVNPDPNVGERSMLEGLDVDG